MTSILMTIAAVAGCFLVYVIGSLFSDWIDAIDVDREPRKLPPIPPDPWTLRELQARADFEASCDFDPVATVDAEVAPSSPDTIETIARRAA